ncbi:MAG: DUF11 domain-containing protein, partial [Chloroflexi bacterium]|nr:DUF11 domain-containing protein [Chloroflexota bacterium]
VGNDLTWTLAVTNNGPSEAPSVSVSDALPTGTTLVSASGTGWSCSGTTTVTCTRATLAVGAAPSITVTVTVGASVAQGTVLSNTATVSTSSIDTNPANDSATATTTVNAQADLSMIKTDSPDPVIAGNNLTYTLAVTNNGPSNAANVSVSDTLPAGVTLVSATGSGWSCSGTTAITCTRASGSVGALPAISVTVSVPSNTAQGTVLNNSATVSSATTDPNPGNETGNASTTVNTSADLIASKTSSVGTVRAGEQFNYIITVLNNGPSDAQNVQITDTLPPEVFFQAAFPSTGTCPTTPAVGTSGTVICNFGTVPNGGFVSVTLQVSVDSGFTGSSVTNSVTATSNTGDPSSADNTSNVNTTVTQVVDIAVSVVDNPPNVNAGQNVTYTLDVVNNGPSDAQNVTLNNPVPADVTIV